ncbi:activity-regulated cytoskeleton-associated protein-like [Aphis gossypii]|uniref:activity-regulated cytoskeleton-associated protein-like n=1 Tax=Aphis gossypii TaxID=80765 RepID=UPI002158C6CC|nr:activity-regulated cytoskeleton-associated protein-like [Aphis gossypii]
MCQYPPHMYTYEPHQSILIPYDDVCTARFSLPEFHGTTPEDPVRFIHKAESVLYQSRIDRSGWTNIIEPQLKGVASTWWSTIRLLDLTWDEFRAEFLEKFDNADMQSRLRAEIVSVRQTSTQTLTEFVIKKNQLARRINTGLPEPQLVSTITELTRDEYRTHIRLQSPATFADLRRIAGILDYTPEEIPPPPLSLPRPKPQYKQVEQTRATRQTHQPRTRDGTAGKPLPPNSCKHCGGPHRNSDCPGYTPASGNGN